MPSDSNRREFLAAIGAAGALGLAGCMGDGGDGGDGADGAGGGDETPTGADETTPGGDTPTEGDGGGGDTRLSWHAGGTGGTYFPLSNEFKTIVEDNTDYRLQVQSTGASVENAGNLGAGNANFALLQNDVAYFAVEGTGIDAFDGNPIPSIRGVATLYPETIHIVTVAGTGVESVSDLSGATINTGDLGSGTQVNATQILEALEISDYTEQNAGFAQAAEQLQNGDIDAAFVVGGYPVGAIEDLANTQNVRIIPIEGENRQQVLNAQDYFAEDEIPADAYSGVEEAVPTVAVQAMIGTQADQDEETVRAITEAIFENTDQLSIKQDFITAESALDGMSIDLHPGAQAYFDEAGVGDGGGGTQTTTNGSQSR